jgi:hypothetical protein
VKWRTWGRSVLAGATLIACSGPRQATQTQPVPVAVPVGSTSGAASAPLDGGPASPPRRAERPSSCQPPAPGTTSDDESPTIRGATGSLDLVEWLGARGVGREAAFAWLTAHYGPQLTREHAETAFSYSRCGALRVGEPAEEALVCEHAVPTSLMQVHALAVVVRSKRPVAVLDVGVGIVAMDFPDARWLDLTLTLDPDGRSATLEDRAPDGTTLVEARSACLAHEKFLAECDDKLAAHPNPESFTQKVGGGEAFATLDDCPLHRRKDGRIAVLQRSEMQQQPFAAVPAKLHDCAGGREALKGLQRELAQAPAEARADARQSLAFYDKSCAQRGRWVWSKDRFVRAK